MPRNDRETVETEEWDRLAPRYADEVISPFHPSVRFPLRRDLRRQIDSWQQDQSLGARSIVDFGCGCGEALSLVAGRVGLSAGVDFSRGMLAECRRRLRAMGLTSVKTLQTTRALRLAIDTMQSGRHAPTVLLVPGDLRRLQPLTDSVDIALTINSICPSSSRQATRLFHNIAATVKPNGLLVGVFPSRDTMHHLFHLFRVHGRDPSEVGAIQEDRGIFISAAGERQKFFTPDEIRTNFFDAGFRLTCLKKIYYPWKLMRASGWGYFPRRERVWDWYAVGELGGHG